MIPSAATRHWLSRSARQYGYALWMAMLFSVVTIKIFWLTDATLVTAMNGPYGALAVAAAGFIAACIGIARFAPPPPPFQSERQGSRDDGPETR